jgi:hypothetical protein
MSCLHKVLCSLIIFAVFTANIVAQEETVPKQNGLFHAGVRLGFTASQLSGDDLSGFHKLGAYAGVYSFLPISKNRLWSFQMEINFCMKGSSTFSKDINDPNIGDKYILHLFYAELPLLFKYLVFKNFEIELGPTINFLFKSIEKDWGGIIKGRPSFTFYEIAAMGGVSYLFKKHYIVSLRYSNSILPIRKPTWVYDRIVNLQFNSSIIASICYQF